MQLQSKKTSVAEVPMIDFLWVELTNVCNMSCKHCYAESGPNAGNNDHLSYEQYRHLISEARLLGCTKIQFIGGEPTLYPQLVELIEYANELGFSFIEVFSNLIRLPENLVACFKKNDVFVGTSVYGACKEIHEAVTLKKGSFDKTITNIKRLLEVSVPVRAGVIEMDVNIGAYESTKNFLNGLGVENVGSDKLREFGRASSRGETNELSSLCGSCAGRTLCVGADGRVSPCIMSKSWSTGSLCDGETLSTIADSEKLKVLRSEISAATATREENSLTCAPGCSPCFPHGNCVPHTNCGPQNNFVSSRKFNAFR